MMIMMSLLLVYSLVCANSFSLFMLCEVTSLLVQPSEVGVIRLDYSLAYTGTWEALLLKTIVKGERKREKRNAQMCLSW